MFSPDRAPQRWAADGSGLSGGGNSPTQPPAFLDTSSANAPLYRVVDEPLADNPEARRESVLAIRHLDRTAVIKALRQYRGLPHFEEGQEVDPIILSLVKLNGLAAGHSLGTLWQAVNTPGAEILILERIRDEEPVGYMTYFTQEHPEHFTELDSAVRKNLGPDVKYITADTVVIADPECCGGYTFMMAQMILECREKCEKDGVTQLLTMVRLFPNPNTAVMDHEKMGWRSLLNAEGKEIYISEWICPEATAEASPGLFKAIYLDIYSKTAERIISAAAELTNLCFDDRDLPRRSFPPEKDTAAAE